MTQHHTLRFQPYVPNFIQIIYCIIICRLSSETFLKDTLLKFKITEGIPLKTIKQFRFEIQKLIYIILIKDEYLLNFQ